MTVSLLLAAVVPVGAAAWAQLLGKIFVDRAGRLGVRNDSLSPQRGEISPKEFAH